jgi:TrpR-related protein YerC/YecD
MSLGVLMRRLAFLTRAKGEKTMYESKLRSQELDKLFEAILSLKDKEECYRFFDDLCTITEIQSMAQSFEVAMMLRQGMTYQVIAHQTGASTATISRVNRCLAFGADGYRTVLDRLEKAPQQETTEEKA